MPAGTCRTPAHRTPVHMQSHLTAPTAQVRFRHVQPHGQAAFELELHARFCKHRAGARQRRGQLTSFTLTLTPT